MENRQGTINKWQKADLGIRFEILYSFVIQLRMRRLGEEKSRIIPIRVSLSTYKRIDSESEAHGLSNSAFIRMLIMKGLPTLQLPAGAMERKHEGMQADFLKLTPMQRIEKMEKIKNEFDSMRRG